MDTSKFLPGITAIFSLLLLPVLSGGSDSGGSFNAGSAFVSADFAVRESVGQLHVTGAGQERLLEVYDARNALVDSGTTDTFGSLIFRQLPAGEGYSVREAGSDPVAAVLLDLHTQLAVPVLEVGDIGQKSDTLFFSSLVADQARAQFGDVVEDMLLLPLADGTRHFVQGAVGQQVLAKIGENLIDPYPEAPENATKGQGKGPQTGVGVCLWKAKRAFILPIRSCSRDATPVRRGKVPMRIQSKLRCALSHPLRGYPRQDI